MGGHNLPLAQGARIGVGSSLLPMSKSDIAVLVGTLLGLGAVALWVPVREGKRIRGEPSAAAIAETADDWDWAHGVLPRNRPERTRGSWSLPYRRLVMQHGRDEFLDIMRGRAWDYSDVPWPPRWVWIWSRQPVRPMRSAGWEIGERVRWPIVLGELGLILVLGGALMTVVVRRRRRCMAGA